MWRASCADEGESGNSARGWQAVNVLDNLFDSIDLFIQDHVGAWWVLLVVFALCFIDGIIPPLPSESVVVALAAIAVSGEGEPNLALLFVVAAAGAFAGDQTAYTIGRHSPVARLAQSRHERLRKAMAWADRQLARRGAMIIIAARYLPVGRIAVNFTAGAIAFPRPTFIRFDLIAATTWSGYSIGIGALAGQWMKDSPLLGAAIAVCLAMVIGYVVDRVMSRRAGVPAADRSSADAADDQVSDPAADTGVTDDAGTTDDTGTTDDARHGSDVPHTTDALRTTDAGDGPRATRGSSDVGGRQGTDALRSTDALHATDAGGIDPGADGGTTRRGQGL